MAKFTNTNSGESGIRDKAVLNRYVLTDEIYTLLKQYILEHRLPSGEKVNIDQLARELDVSNIPIREALSRLATEGLIQVVAFKGMFVTPLTLKEFDEIYEIRIHLETIAVKKAALAIPESELVKLKESMVAWRAEFENGINNEDVTWISKMNEGVHGIILVHCGNDTLRGLIRSYIEKIQRYLTYIHQELSPATIQNEWDEHEDIVNGLLMRNAEVAAESMRRHLTESYQRTRTYFL